MRKGKWFNVDLCVECEKQLSNRVLMYSNATCPYCGHNAPGTFCNVTSTSARYVMPYKWYEFWKYHTRYSERLK